MKKITGFEIMEAARRVNLPFAKGWFKAPDGHILGTDTVRNNDHLKIAGGCILGQIAYELGVSATRLSSELNRATTAPRIGSEIIEYNDHTAQNLDQAREFALELLKKVKAEEFELPEVTYFYTGE